MLSKKGFFQSFLLATISILGAAQQVRAEDFYKDKTIFFVVGYSPGGSFDT
jgi:tripartite-type tricarboxylate transporter receptor subunit TctC